MENNKKKIVSFRIYNRYLGVKLPNDYSKLKWYLRIHSRKENKRGTRKEQQERKMKTKRPSLPLLFPKPSSFLKKQEEFKKPMKCVRFDLSFPFTKKENTGPIPTYLKTPLFSEIVLDHKGKLICLPSLNSYI